MPIEFSNKFFHIYNNNLSYVIEISEFGDLLHRHWGEKLFYLPEKYAPQRRPSNSAYESVENKHYSLDALPLEYPVYGTTDLREPALVVELSNGSRVVEPRYASHKIYAGKPKLEGLPTVYVESESEATTLEINLEDKSAGVGVILYYTVFEELDVICRSTKVRNLSDTHMYIEKVSSVGMDFSHDNYKYMRLSGTYYNEKKVEYNDVHKGTQGFESKRGLSGHYDNPFMAVMDKSATENSGEVYGFSLVYSGNHFFRIDSNEYELMRVQAGINPFNFRWKLDAGENFQAPEAVLVYSANGLGDMSRTYHKLYRTRLCRGYWRDRTRPVVINSWEATYFDFNEEKILDFAQKSAEMGVDIFVLDDGWFGKRNDDTTSLGDWFVNYEKLPSGIDGLAEKINSLGMKFGLWFEPEMISIESELYKAHPDYMICVPGRIPHPARYQYVLDLTRLEVREYIINAICGVIENANIAYVKWDMNRPITDAYSASLGADRQGELMHRYMIGLYEVMDEITSRFPEVLFESCASGGGRYDPGMLYYMPQVWTSDSTNPINRIPIQYGNSMVYPASTMAAHVSASGMKTSMKYRGAISMAGMLGYELDVRKISDAEFEEGKEQIKFYREICDVVTFGDFYRLLDTVNETYFAWMYVSEDKSRAVLTAVTKWTESNGPRKWIRLKGLDPNAYYEIRGKKLLGYNLMEYGIEFSLIERYNAEMYVLTKVE